MNNGYYSIRIKTPRVETEISGDRSFVEKKAEDFIKRFDLEKTAEMPSTTLAKAITSPNNSTLTQFSTTIPQDQDFGIYSVKDGKIYIHQAISPKENKAERTKKIALIATYARQGEWVETKDIIDLCKEQACFDSGNFASTITSCEDTFQFLGNGRKRKIRLTAIGKIKARDLIEELQNPSTEEEDE